MMQCMSTRPNGMRSAQRERGTIAQSFACRSASCHSGSSLGEKMWIGSHSDTEALDDTEEAREMH
ncbi:hypothetical protein BD309DRAFT_828852, partial [Dichomitus squalens]